MQGNAIKHLQERNLAKLQQVTIELLEPGMGRVMGSIPDVIFVDSMNQVPAEESIGERLSNMAEGFLGMMKNRQWRSQARKMKAEQ